MLKIAIVENEDIIAEKLAGVVTKLGYRVVGRAIGAEELYTIVAKEEKPNLILMDIDIEGDKDGTVLALEMKKEYGISSVFISGYTEAEILDLAGDSEPLAFLVKPYKHKDIEVTLSLAEKKLKNLADKKSHENVIKFDGGYQYNLSNNLIYKNGKLFDFTSNEKKFIDILVFNYGSTVPFYKIFSYVWGSDEVDMTSVRNLVKRIRDKMEVDIIHSVRGVGYRLR